MSVKGQVISVDHSTEMPAIPLNQGATSGACVAFATAYLLTWMEGQEISWDVNLPEHQFSPAFIYNSLHIHGTAFGIGISRSLNFVQQEGCITLDQFPYDEFDDTLAPDDALRYQALYFRTGINSSSFDLNVAKQELVNSPIITVIQYGSYSHCVCLVGYDDTIHVGNYIGAFKYINSYGPSWSGNGIDSWGSGGFGWLPYQKANMGFYFIQNRINSFPSLAFKFIKKDSIMSTPNYFFLLAGIDTLYKELFTPVQDVHSKFFLALDDSTQSADRLIVKIMYAPTDSIRECFQYDSNNNFLPLSGINYFYSDSLSDGSVIPRRNYEYSLLSQLVMIDEPKENENNQLKVFPNPFHGTGTFQINLEEKSEVSLFLFDLAGRKIKTLLNDETLLPGNYEINFSENLSPGIYLAELISGQIKKIIKINVQ